MDHEPVIEAAKEGKALLLKSLVEQAPTKINVKDQDGRTALHWALSSGHSECASIILKAARQSPGSNGFDIDESDDAGWTAVHLAAATGNLELLRMIVDQFAPKVTAQANMGQTPLHFAVSKSHIDVVRYLLTECKVSAGIKDKQGQSALHRAAAMGSLPIAEMLVEAKCPVNATDRTGWTPLHHAMAEGNGHMAVWLIAHGADRHVQDHDGLDAMAVALDNKVRVFVENECS